MTPLFGDTVSLHDKLPLTAFVEITVAGHTLRSLFPNKETTRGPEYIQSLEITRAGVSSDFTLVLYDKNWTELEETFSLGAQEVTLKYGYVNGKQSPTYRGSVIDYSINYLSVGILLTIHGITADTLLNTDLVTLNTGTKNPTEAVKAICRSKGWTIGSFEETYDINIPHNDYFTLIKDHPLSYINLSIAPYAVRKSDGMSGFRLLLDNSTNPYTAHFLPLAEQRIASKTYIYGKGINSSVISLEVTATGVFGGSGALGTTTDMETSVIDPNTGEVSSARVNTSNSVNATGYTNTPSTQRDIVSSDGLTSTMTIKSTLFNTSLRQSIPFTGTMTLLGDPELDLRQLIRVIVLTSTGELHLSSGNYLIDNITDSLVNGKYLTSVSLKRLNGLEEGLELYNYKKLVRGDE
jgi:hypothetical protein